jgi:ankyrin repeat protein
MVRLLLKAGADINERGGVVYLDIYRDKIVCTKGTALELARERGHTGVVSLLEEALGNMRV